MAPRPGICAIAALLCAAGVTRTAWADHCPAASQQVLATGCYRAPNGVAVWGGEFVWLSSGNPESIIQSVSGVVTMCRGATPVTEVACPKEMVKACPSSASPKEAAALMAIVASEQEERMRHIQREQEAMRIQQIHLEQMVRILTSSPGEAIASSPVPVVAPVTYVPIGKIQPGQVRYSKLAMRERMDAAIKAGDAVQEGRGAYSFRYDKALSHLSPDAAVPVILGPSGYVLIGGIADVMAGLQLGVRTVPVKVVVDLSSLSVGEFWRQADEKGYVYPYASGGAWQQPPRTLMELADDPIRFFAAFTARNCAAVGQVAAETTGAEFPLWIKLASESPYVEYRIADALFKQGFRYRDDQGIGPPEAAVEDARTLLRGKVVKGMKLVSERTRYTEISGICAP